MLLPWLLCHLTVVAAIPILQHGKDGHNVHSEQKICETTYCNEIATNILRNRDLSVDPCEDFYGYACGSWEKWNPIPSNELEWSPNEILTAKTNKRIRDILEKPDSSTDILPVRLARKLYRSCMDEVAIERGGIEPLQKILDRTGGWPMAMPVSEWNPSEVPWQKIDKHHMRLIGTNAFYVLDPEIDMNNTKRFVLAIDQDIDYPGLDTNDEYYIFDNDENTVESTLHRTVLAFAREKGYVLNRSQLNIDIQNVVKFRSELFKIMKDGKEKHISSTNSKRMTIKELQEWYNQSGVSTAQAKINFLSVLQYAFKLANVSIDSSEPIVVYNPDFLHKLAKLLADTSPRVLVNYVQWNMICNLLAFSTKEMRDIQFDIVYSTYNVSNYTPRWQQCIDEMDMRDAISYMFVKDHTSDYVIHEATKMVKKIKDELRHKIEHAYWITGSTKSSLMEKLDNLIMQIGYPDWYKDDEAVIEYYKGLRIDSDYFQNVLNYFEREFIKLLKSFREKVNRNQWPNYPITVNAFYGQTTNAILIPAAELQEPSFTPHLPDAINYGTTGFVIGHELSHGYDDDGIRLDNEGRKMQWSSSHVKHDYNERATCFVNQYNHYTLNVTDENENPFKLDGHLTQNENMADLSGVQIAYAAFKKVAKRKEQTKLPGLEDVSDDELFFLAYANSWCTSTRPEYAKDAISADEHSPAKFRVIGSLSNMAAFSKVFKCPPNSPMNRRHKCTLWN